MQPFLEVSMGGIGTETHFLPIEHAEIIVSSSEEGPVFWGSAHWQYKIAKRNQQRGLLSKTE